MIERRLENLLALDYPADQLELVVTSDASTDRTTSSSSASATGVRLIVQPARRQGRRAGPGRARDDGEIVAFSDANATWAPDALRQLVANFADPDVAYVCGQLVLEAADGLEPRGRLLALRAGAARGGVAARLDHRRQRLDLRGPPRRLRRGRPEVGPRPRVPVPDGAGGPARRLRARGARVREADAVERDRVPAQGAHVRALLADHAAGLDAEAAAARLPRRGRLAPAPPLRQRAAAPRPARDVARARRRGARLPGRARRRSSRCSRPRCRRRDRALLRRSSRGRPSSRSGTTCAAACPRRGRRRRARAEPRARRRHRRGRARRSRARCSALAALAVKLEDGGPVLYRQTRVGKDGRTSSC